MTGADALYDQTIKTLAASPAPPQPDRIDATARADNPLCGDRATVTVQVEDDKVASVSHQIRGCLLCRASASLLANSVPGLRIEDAKNLAQSVKDYLAGTELPPTGGWEAFLPLRSHPARHTCALLPLQALRQALTAGKF